MGEIRPVRDAERRPPLSPRTRRRFALAVVLIALGLALVMVEVGARVLSGMGVLKARTLPHNSLQYRGAVYARHVMLAREGTVTLVDGRRFPINGHGYRGGPFDETPAPGTVRIVVYGGSQVFDQNVSGPGDWVQRVGAKLRAMGLPVQTINAGIPGHASADSVGRLLTEGHRWRPDIVVLDNAWNDMKHLQSDRPLLRQLRPMAGRDPRTNYYGGLDRWLCEVSFLYTSGRYRFLSWWLDAGGEGVATRRGQRSDHVLPGGLRQYRLNLAAFVEIARNMGAEPVLLTQPRMPRSDTAPADRGRVRLDYVGLSWEGVLSTWGAMDELTREVARDKKATLIPAMDAVPPDALHFTDAVHTTPAGSEALATAVAAALKDVVRARMRGTRPHGGAPATSPGGARGAAPQR